MTFKPRPISGNLPFDAIAKDYNRYCDRIVGNGGTIFLQPETVAHIERVEADGGTVEDAGFLNSFVLNAKSNNYWNEIVTAYSPSWGVKEVTGASKLYSISGAAFDIVQATTAKQPAIMVGQRNGRTVLRFDGSDDSFDPKAFAHTDPSTVILGGFQNITWTTSRWIFDGFTGSNLSYFQNTGTHGMTANAGSSKSHEFLPVGEYGLVKILFDGVGSQHGINEAAVVEGDLGGNVGDGLTLGTNAGAALPANFDMGCLVMLDSTVDGSYAGKMGSIRDYLSVIYNTPWQGFGAKGSITYGLIGDSIATDPAIFTNNDQTAAITLDNTGGVGGNTLAQIDARTAPYVAGVTQSKTWVIGGANDFVAAASDPNASAQASIQSITDKIVAGGSVPILSTMQPFGNHASWTAQRQTWTDTYDAFIVSYAAANGWDVMDMVAALSDDNLTLKAAFDSGDGLHPNSQGSFAMDDAFNLIIR